MGGSVTKKGMVAIIDGYPHIRYGTIHLSEKRQSRRFKSLHSFISENFEMETTGYLTERGKKKMRITIEEVE